MSFTTKELVRAESGFNNNSNIVDTTILTAIAKANGMLLGYVGGSYDISKLSGSIFTGSQAENLLKTLEGSIASGYLLIDEYGAEAKDTDKDGYKKVSQAKIVLQDILLGNIRLFDINGNEFSGKESVGSGSITMTAPDSNPNLIPTFTTDMKF